MAAYKDPVRANELLTGIPESFEAFHAEMDTIRTAKWTVHGLGHGLFLLAVLLFLAVWRFRLWEPGSLKGVGTPKSGGRYLLLTVSVWLGALVAMIFDLLEERRRGLVHPLDDAAERSLIQGFPLMLGVFALLCVASLIAKMHAMSKVTLPVSLWERDPRRPDANWLWTCLYSPPAAFLLFLAISTGFSGMWQALPFALGAYLTLCSRALRVAGGAGARPGGKA